MASVRSHPNTKIRSSKFGNKTKGVRTPASPNVENDHTVFNTHPPVQASTPTFSSASTAYTPSLCEATPDTTKTLSPSDVMSPTARAGGSVMSHVEMELRRQLEAAYALIEEKDQDLKMAAEVGQGLFDKCQLLEKEYEKLLNENKGRTHSNSNQDDGGGISKEMERGGGLVGDGGGRSVPAAIPTILDPDDTFASLAEAVRHAPAVAPKRRESMNASTAMYISSLEQSLSDLQTRLESLTNDFHECQESEKAKDRQCKKLEEEVEQVRVDLDAAIRQQQELEVEKRKIAKEKLELIAQLKSTRAQYASNDKLLERLQDLEGLVMTLSEARAEAEAAVAIAAEDRADQERRCKELEDLVEQYREYRDECERVTNQVAELQFELEGERYQVEVLQSRLSRLESNNDDGDEDKGSKTLLGEVEDKRKELEDRHKVLSQRHLGLVKAHSMTVHEKDRMRNHIVRLTQLANTGSGDYRFHLVEQALQQTESELAQERAKNSALEKALSQALAMSSDGATRPHTNPISPSSSSSSQPAAPKVDQQELIQCLRFRIENLSRELEGVRKELRTAQMLKLSETNKLRAVETSLHERDAELDRIRVINAKLKFDMDEIKTKLRNTNAVATGVASAKKEAGVGEGEKGAGEVAEGGLAHGEVRRTLQDRSKDIKSGSEKITTRSFGITDGNGASRGRETRTGTGGSEPSAGPSQKQLPQQPNNAPLSADVPSASDNPPPPTSSTTPESAITSITSTKDHRGITTAASKQPTASQPASKVSRIQQPQSQLPQRGGSTASAQPSARARKGPNGGGATAGNDCNQPKQVFVNRQNSQANECKQQ